MRIKRRCNVQKQEYDLGATTYPIVLHTHITSNILYTLYAYIMTSVYYHSNTKSQISFACYLPIPNFCLITEPFTENCISTVQKHAIDISNARMGDVKAPTYD